MYVCTLHEISNSRNYICILYVYVKKQKQQNLLTTQTLRANCIKKDKENTHTLET